MATQLYYVYPILTECIAKVLSCEKAGELYAIRLDRSIIFPEGGGQLPDKGTINEIPIVNARTVNGETIHYCESPVNEGSIVPVKLDLESRRDHSEQHTGEHILSGLASKLFGASNVGFHMANDYCTIDLDIYLDSNQLKELETEANSAVRANLPITTEVVNGAEAAKRSLRKHADIITDEVQNVRIVYIDGGNIDSCTCCGTHLRTTGEAGAIKIIDSQKYKGGTRLWFVCGARATAYLMALHDSMTTLARQYSTSCEELPNVVRKQMDELAVCKQESRIKAQLIAELYSEALINKAENINNILCICATIDGLNAGDLKNIGEKLCQKAENITRKAVCLLFAENKAGTNYGMACTKGVKLSMKDLCVAVNAAVNGKGGGGTTFAQGKTAKIVSSETIEMLMHYIKMATND